MPSFRLPIDCTPGESCWIPNYVDVDPTEGVKDYQCGWRSYQAHRGTDIAIRDFGEMKAGVKVLAAADGVVANLRDGVKDLGFTAENRNEISKIGCGNTVVLEHDGGWNTVYCHMREGSVYVRKGQKVTAGQSLGLVGFSGLTEFPHLHFGVRYKGKIVDPFVGLTRRAACGLGDAPLWDKGVLGLLQYDGPAIFNTGFAGAPPKIHAVRKGLHHDTVLPKNAPALILWAEIFGVEEGDTLEMKIAGPGGESVLDYRKTLEKRQARIYRYSGAKRTERTWPEGTYRGEIRLIRMKEGENPRQWVQTQEIDLR